MRKLACLLLSALVFAGCDYRDQKEQIRELSVKDSMLLQQGQQKDSSITAYIRSLNDIQDNLNSIKSEEHMISLARENGATDRSASIVSDIKALNALILKNHKDINSLEAQLGRSIKQDKELKKLVENFRQQLLQKDTEIALLEGKLTRSDDSLRVVMNDFKDSVNVINQDNQRISQLQTTMNTVHYAVGTFKELKDRGVVERQGSVIGIGGRPELKANFNKDYFTTAQLPDLQSIQLYGKFDKLVTYHPTDSYKITGGEKVNTLVITDPQAFWSTSKYLVVVISQQQEKAKSSEAGMMPSGTDQ